MILFIFSIVLIVYALWGINIVKEWNRRAVFLFGKYQKTLGAGFQWLEPLFHRKIEVSLQDQVINVKIQNVQTHDNVRLNIFANLTMRVDEKNVRDFITKVADGTEAIKSRAISAMTEVVSTNPLDYILGERVAFSEKVKLSLIEKVKSWGITIVALEISDFKIADEAVEQSIAMKARAEKEAQGELKRAEMQKQVAEKLGEAAAAYDENAWKLKSLETLIELCRSANNNTILIPNDLLSIIAKSIKN